MLVCTSQYGSSNPCPKMPRQARRHVCQSLLSHIRLLGQPLSATESCAPCSWYRIVLLTHCIRPNQLPVRLQPAWLLQDTIFVLARNRDGTAHIPKELG